MHEDKMSNLTFFFPKLDRRQHNKNSGPACDPRSAISHRWSKLRLTRHAIVSIHVIMRCVHATTFVVEKQ